ncbi:prepilin-type N-terminal cleavage/methylation domain-containing protein [Candidatus Sumerlaeota bacterium]|nr:prepilin-type N-terminal cleavage/methylation domain-containing protein [Candidatus Sumerlaeota bacterium]
MKKRGFTLIELLIVVAIIAILAAIAVPNFLEAQTRSKVARVRSDHRSLATAVESYYVDNNEYPAMTGADLSLATAPTADMGAYRTAPTTGVGRTFRARHTTQLLTLTTPIAYITSVFPDPFADTKGIGFRYYTDGPGWILGSWGPDVDEAAGGDLAWNSGTLVNNPKTDLIETVYDNTASAQPSILLQTGAPTLANGRGAFTYDPTNGTISDGDLWRVRQ